MVANPHSFAAADSAAAVRVGTGMREKMETVAEKWYNVIQRNQMNDALVQYGYPPDAVLPPLVARQLASQLQARALVTSTLIRGEGGKVGIESRLTGIGDQTGFMLRMDQAPNQSFEDLGEKLADGLKGAIAALQDAKQCESTRTTDANKATEAANKAIKAQPNHGLAEMCLANIALAKKAPADEVIGHFLNATKGDRMSLEAWGGLLGQYQQKGDTAKIVSTYEALIQLAPNNQKVVEEAVRFFIVAGVPDRAEQIASDAIKLDPSNPDNLMLLFRACLVQGAGGKPDKMKCAIGAAEQMFALDTAKADTLNLQALLYATSSEPVDTARYIKWAQFATKKYPNNATMLTELVKAYGIAGPLDSLVSVTKRVVAADTTDMSPVIRAMRALNKDKRYKESLELLQYIERYGSPTDKQNAGIIVAQEIGLEMLKVEPKDYPVIVEVGKKAASLAPPNSRTAQLANYVVGIGLMAQIGSKDSTVVANKNCDDVNALEAWINETKAALTIGMPIQEAFVKEQLTKIDAAYPPRIAQMRKAYCKA
jgi:tetratricopeptide (TPR) repeat protein